MKYFTVHNANFAFSMMGLKRRGVRLSDYFTGNESIIIYGCSFFGMELYRELKDDLNVVCFIDRDYDECEFEGIKTFSLFNHKLKEVIGDNENIVVVNTVYTYHKQIMSDVKKILPQVRFLSLYDITCGLKLKNPKVIGYDIDDYCRGVLTGIVRDEDDLFDQVVITGTPYTMFLSMLILPNWRKSLYIIVGKLSKDLADAYRGIGGLCIYSDEEVRRNGGIHDITYVISEYCERRGIEIYGHDHVPQSEAFLPLGISVIEDGTDNYFKEDKFGWEMIDCSMNLYRPFGYDEKVKRVFLTGEYEIERDVIAQKAILFDPEEKWWNLSEDDRKSIFTFFDFPYDCIKELSLAGKKVAIFFTDVFKCDMFGLFGNGDIENVYAYVREQVKKLSADIIVIKPHPADDIDYGSLFPDSVVVNKRFPAQLIRIIGLRFDVGLVYHNSAMQESARRLCKKVIRY